MGSVCGGAGRAGGDTLYATLMLEAVVGGLCLLEVSEVPEVLQALDVMRCTLEGLDVLEVTEVMRCVLLCMLEVWRVCSVRRSCRR